MFLIAGLWNIGAGFLSWLAMLIAPSHSSARYVMNYPESLFPFHPEFGAIIAFGIGYLMVSKDITKNRGVVIIGGMIGKPVFFADCVVTVALGEANARLLVPGVVDLVFFLLFLEFLIATRKNLISVPYGTNRDS
jgi:hypothetical protein